MMVRIAALAGLIAAIGAAPLESAPPSGIGLNVTPGKIEIAMRPGSIVNVPVTVRNDSPLPAHVVLSAGDFTVDDDGVYHYDVPGTVRTSLAEWIAVRPREFDIAPQSIQQIQFTLLVPERELTGEYSGVLFVQTRSPRTPGAMGFSARFADKVYAVVSGTAQHGGRVDGIRAGLDTDGNERYRIAFRNSGNLHEYVNGRLEIRRDGVVTQTLPLPKNVLVERGGERTIDVDGTRLMPGAYDIVAVVDYGGDQRTGGRIHFDAR
jgi:hypothetical protein